MTRAEFITRLRRGLSGLPATTIADIVADHEAHFADAQAAGRTEAEVAAALGDPDRLARELRAEAGLKQWEEKKSPSNAMAAIIALIGLGAIDVMFLLPLLMGVLATLFGFLVAVVTLFVSGGFVFAMGPLSAPPGGPLTALLAGVALMAGATFLGSLLTIATVGLFNAVVWYGRLHFRLLKPAINNQG
ncbi:MULTISPECIES: DUF1700 domain-containing protein [unclassified Caulobacter]|jgi:uncharacterized membrane protein|uniref:DUF1700 domain-containing protein n=1 Tax=unclassified Caulobacter TaxID=2648921 RepID=UPI00078256B4|nr:MULTISPECIES: DUF1700 domain-containing protein [unclassified Caulobacter]AZS19718.1 DUF1700 domain-containing protein [Caulobacter sp. FWC26]